MKIGIIGAGNIGGNLTRRFTGLGHEVAVANSRGPETLSELAQETGATAVAVSEAAKGAELLVITIPEKSIPLLPSGVLDGLAPGAVVVDTGNYYPQQRDGRIDAIEDGTPESVWVASQLGHPVVKAFNGIYAAHMLTEGKPAGSPGRIALLRLATGSGKQQDTQRQRHRNASHRCAPSTYTVKVSSGTGFCALSCISPQRNVGSASSSVFT